MRRSSWKAAASILLAASVALGRIVPSLRAEQSLGDKIKRIFEPTPPPKKKKRTTSSATPKKASPTPTPSTKPKASASPTASPKARASASPKPTQTPEASVTPKAKSSPSPSASPSKKKKKGSPTPSPIPSSESSPSPSATPTASTSASSSPTPSPSADEKKDRSSGVSISTGEIAGFDQYPERVRKLIESCLALAARDLSYKYGSADPSSGGLDCSGFVYYVLRENAITDVPRDSSAQYVWVRKGGGFEAVISNSDDSFELAGLKPGHLLFWTGTYDIDRDPPITHAMIYLGREKGTGRRIMIGASDGRTYRDQSRYGVSVFDFKVSRPGRAAANGRSPDFVGYGRIPGLGDG